MLMLAYQNINIHINKRLVPRMQPQQENLHFIMYDENNSMKYFPQYILFEMKLP